MELITERDDRILMAIQDTGDGVLAWRHLKSMFWADNTRRAMQRVMSRLYYRAYIDRKIAYYPRIEKPRSEPIYWLAAKGILRVAEQMGVEEPYHPKNEGENQMRELEESLRAEGIRWVRTLPSTAKLEHDFFFVDLRLMLEKSAAELLAVTIDWINESAFRSPQMDTVKFMTKDRYGRMVKNERGVCPDGFALIEDRERKQNGLPHKLYLLIEVDMGTHPVRSRSATRMAAYATYIGSPAYKARFGTEAGNWLIVTTIGKLRMKNLMRQTGKTAGERAGRFLFTYWNLLEEGNLLTTPIWYKVEENEPIALLD